MGVPEPVPHYCYRIPCIPGRSSMFTDLQVRARLIIWFCLCPITRLIWTTSTGAPISGGCLPLNYCMGPISSFIWNGLKVCEQSNWLVVYFACVWILRAYFRLWMLLSTDGGYFGLPRPKFLGCGCGSRVAHATSVTRCPEHFGMLWKAEWWVNPFSPIGG